MVHLARLNSTGGNGWKRRRGSRAVTLGLCLTVVLTVGVNLGGLVQYADETCFCFDRGEGVPCGRESW